LRVTITAMARSAGPRQERGVPTMSQAHVRFDSPHRTLTAGLACPRGLDALPAESHFRTGETR
jgi:hypothetical protein